MNFQGKLGAATSPRRSEPTAPNRAGRHGRTRAAKARRTALALCMACAAGSPAWAGEGGTSHILPGANATLVDLPPTDPGFFFKPMFLNYRGDAAKRVPTAAGVVANMEVEANTLVLGGGYGFETKVLGGAHYAVAAFLPYTSLDISASSEALGGLRIDSEVSGFGDMTLVPVMLAWKSDEWQYDFLMPVYAPTGSYELGRLGNPGLNYWTVDPIVGAAYSNPKSGLNASVHVGWAFNTENPDTDYKSGNILHLDASVQQIIPLGSGFANLGAEAWYFEQTNCDSGSGAKLGCFKGRTAGIGPVLGFIQPLGTQKLIFEFKWLAELDTENRLKGDFLWLKMVYKF
jgi:hypothetical protein